MATSGIAHPEPERHQQQQHREGDRERPQRDDAPLGAQFVEQVLGGCVDDGFGCAGLDLLQRGGWRRGWRGDRRRNGIGGEGVAVIDACAAEVHVIAAGAGADSKSPNAD